MKRREFISALGLGSLGVFGYRGRTNDRLVVTVWQSEQAATYEGVTERVEEYLRLTFGPAFDRVVVRTPGTVSLSTEDAYEVMTNTEWPRKLLGEVAPWRDAPVGDVNLLITDGDTSHAPSGMGVPYVAAVGGARHVARTPPAPADGDVVPVSKAALVTQIAVHECGHALGLDHDHGAIYDDGDRVVVTPMVSAYAWAPDSVKDAHFDFERSACGTPFDTAGSEYYLSFRLSACARSRLGD